MTDSSTRLSLQRNRRHGSLRNNTPTRSLSQTRRVNGGTVGRGCEADAAFTATDVSSTMIRQRQESTKDAQSAISPSKTGAENESADPSSSHHDRRGLTETALRHRDGAVPQALVVLALVTLAVLPHVAEAAAPTVGADHRRQGGDNVTTSTTSLSQIDLGGVDVTATTTVLVGQMAAALQGGPTRIENRLHSVGSKALQTQAYEARHQTETRIDLRVGIIVMVSANTATVATITTPRRAER